MTYVLILANISTMLDWSGGWGWRVTPSSMVLTTAQVFIDHTKNSQKYIADPRLVLPQIEYTA